jgi:pimeloyl-ACP methyl ester carboxylesterase
MEEDEINWPVNLSYTTRNMLSLAYRYHAGNTLTIVYTGGFNSNMNGTKANQIFKQAVAKGYSALSLDYSGHGSSGGNFAEGNISTWLEDTLHIINKVTTGPLIICGSSMGGWIALLASLRLRERIKGIVTIAAATDMTENFIWDRCDDEHTEKLLTEGFFEWQSPYDDEPYIITMQLIIDGRKHLLLNQEIDLHCPIRMLHGTADEDIDWENSLATMNRLKSENVHLKLIKGAGHRLSETKHITAILSTLDEVINEHEKKLSDN